MRSNAALDKMLLSCAAFSITVLVVWRDDRIVRAAWRMTLMNAVSEVCWIEFVTQPHLNDLSTMAGRISLAVMAEVSNAETTTKRERVRMGRDRIRAEGGFVGRAVWGYEITGTKYAKTIVPTEQGRALVPEVYARRIHVSPAGHDRGRPEGKTAQASWPRTVGAMVRNPVRTLVQVGQGRRVIHRVAEPLVDAATFARAGKALDTRPKRGHSDPANRAMLAGALFCPQCADSPMYRLNTGYYRCTGRGASRRGCGNMVPVGLADAAADQIIMTYFATPVMAHTIIPGNEAETAARLEEIQFEIRQLGAAELDDAEYDRRLAALRAERDEIRAAPVVPDRVELTDTGERYAELWQRTPVPERGPWLARHGFRVTASRTEVTVAQGTTFGRIVLAPGA